MDNTTAVPLALVIASGCATLLLASGLTFVMIKKSYKGRRRDTTKKEVIVNEAPSVIALDKNKYPGGHLTVYYGSQTGTAESFARQIEREDEKNGFKVSVVDLEETEGDVPSALLCNRDCNGKSRAVFLMATYGEGEPTDNAASFVHLLKTLAGVTNDVKEEEEKKGEIDGGLDEDPTLFSGLEYAVFGLGNRQYEHFNAMGKFVDEALSKTGASRITELGLGDDDNDLEGDFENWKDSILWPTLKKRYIAGGIEPKISGGSTKNRVAFVEIYNQVEYLDKFDGKADEIPLDRVHLSSKHYFTSVDCPVTAKRELRSPEDNGSTLHIEIGILGKNIQYQTADNLGVMPVNDASVVEAVANALNFDLDAMFRLKPTPGHESKHAAPFPTPCTIRECLSRYCDLTSAPRRSELKLLSAYAQNPTCQKALSRMSSKEGKEEYREKIVNGHVGLVDIVSRLCDSIEMSFDHFLAICPRLQPRYYTISSSSSLHPDSIHITVAILKEQRKDGSLFRGVCSNHLAEIVSNGMVRVFLRDSSFRLPSDATKPIIMIGPGTGIAPMRALLQERSYTRLKRNMPVGPNVLYFGCKNRKQDYLYSDEIKALQNEGTLTTLHVAFSREQTKKIYVQHLLALNAREIWSLIDRECASIYVCGGVKMGQDVTDTLKTIVSDSGNLTLEEAKAYLDKMASDGRFVQELWG